MLYAKIAALLAALALGFTAGWKVQGWRCEANEAEAAEQARELRAQQARQADAAAATFEQTREQQRAEIQTITRTVEKMVERPIYKNICLDDDGLKQLSSAAFGPVTTDLHKTFQRQESEK